MVQYDLVIDVKANEAVETGFLLTTGDTAIKFVLKVLNDGTFMEPSSAKIVFCRPDGTTKAGTLVPSNSDATELLYSFDGSEFTVPGKNSFVVVLTDSDGKVTTGHVNFDVILKPVYST